MCQTITDYVRRYSAQLKKKWRLYLKLFSWDPQTRHTHTNTDTHNDNIRQNAMRCILPKHGQTQCYHFDENFAKIGWIVSEIFKVFSQSSRWLIFHLKNTDKVSIWHFWLGGKTESWFMLRYPATDLMISLLLCNLENFRTKTKIIQELELNKN